MQPIIGITTYGRVEKPSATAHYDRHFAVPDLYVNAVRRGGGVAVLLPPGEREWERWLDIVDGVVSSGGTDIDPQNYGAERASSTEAGDAERDASELALARAVIERDVPALFVCRGMQILNVALGGTLHQHVPALGFGDIHRDEQGGWAFHEVEAIDGSLVAETMAAATATPCSGHHQALDVIADRLAVTASAPDGIVEAVEVAGNSWCLGVQWHPEVSADRDPTQQRLFDGLVSAARQRREALI
ncbi:MAG: gamma-glutamyl-gamma-aminobutyrate hydrolase family protein [Acidimicrobiia bacterium]|nr:gamma-glutamyl-gamma-aminobutyrate hydrolase family protein [Acidimicrobiia bacterium]